MTSCMDIGRLGFWLIQKFWYWNFDDLFPNNKEKLVEFTLENKKYPKKFVEKNRQNLWGDKTTAAGRWHNWVSVSVL